MKQPAVTWQRLAITAAAALSTYYLRSVLAAVNLQALTYLLPVLFAGYLFGSAMAAIAAALTLATIHGMLWVEAPAILFSRQYFGGILNFTLFAGLIVVYAYRHEQVLRRLDSSLERERAAREDAESANRLKDQFLATLSHELRTPINVILGYLRLLLDERTTDPRRALEIAHRNAQQQARLIEDVLDVSRITTGTVQIHPVTVRPLPLLRDALDSLQPAIAAKGLQLHLDSADDADVTILADPDRLRQVFWNLLSNAVKFTPEGGRIDVRAHRDGPHVEFTVRDTGRGIAADFLPHVFEIFRQADPSTTREVSGMGLGLSLVKRFVELQGGQVWAASPGEGQGSTFTCRFPVAAPAPRTKPAAGLTPATELPG
jgi:signal transduction histidine kinase